MAHRLSLADELGCCYSAELGLCVLRCCRPSRGCGSFGYSRRAYMFGVVSSRGRGGFALVFLDVRVRRMVPLI